MLIKVRTATFSSLSSMVIIKGLGYSGAGYCAQTKSLSIQFKELEEGLALRNWDAHFLITTKSLKTHSIITFADMLNYILK